MELSNNAVFDNPRKNRDRKKEERDMGLMNCCVGCGTLGTLDKWWPVSCCHSDTHNLHSSGTSPRIPPDTSTSSPASLIPNVTTALSYLDMLNRFKDSECLISFVRIPQRIPAHTFTLFSTGSTYLEKRLCSLNSGLGCALNSPWRITLSGRPPLCCNPSPPRRNITQQWNNVSWCKIWRCLAGSYVTAIFQCGVQTDALTPMSTWCSAVYNLMQWITWNGEDDAFSHWQIQSWQLLHISGTKAHMFLLVSDCSLLFVWILWKLKKR